MILIDEVIIDVERKGNVLRFYLGKYIPKWGYTNPNNTKSAHYSRTYFGDDWDDVPYEHNAGRVYDEFVWATLDCYIPFDYDISEPCFGKLNSEYCKNDFCNGMRPYLYIYKKNNEYDFGDTYEDMKNKKEKYPIFLGHKMSDVLNNVPFFKIEKLIRKDGEKNGF